ncbi:MAG: family 43 glycosylhydrolase [Bacteroidetes bacterium]|nr:family 43 glycosylhydrolase [Bacteroidales bacterium]NJO69554.1 family 43 glycosylhydrolase [Bacteroidota bacterium]
MKFIETSLTEKMRLGLRCFVLISILSTSVTSHSQTNQMMFGDTIRLSRPFSKDPHVIRFNQKYLMYYSVPGFTDKKGTVHGWGIGIAESSDLIKWERMGEVGTDPGATYESKGFAAPCAIVVRDTVHLFYQTYGNGKNDAICHAWSVDGLTFIRNTTNPIFQPDGDWNCGRAIDAEVYFFRNRFYLYYVTRDTDYKIQMLGVATTPANTRFNRQEWTHQSLEGPILKPELPWEGNCIEGASIIERNNKLYMFYAGNYNNQPQQIGIAESSDGIQWKRISDVPFLKNGNPGEWNSSESGHPHIFDDGNRTYLFFQGNNDNGRTWKISNIDVCWEKMGPLIKI